MNIQVGKDTYEIASDESRLATEYIHKVWEKAGRPNRLDTEASWKVMDTLFQVWAGCYPDEFLDFKYSIQESQEVERTVHEAVKQSGGGHIPISYPSRLLMMIKVYFPDERLQDHNLIRKFVNRYSILKVTKYNI